MKGLLRGEALELVMSIILATQSEAYSQVGLCVDAVLDDFPH